MKAHKLHSDWNGLLLRHMLVLLIRKIYEMLPKLGFIISCHQPKQPEGAPVLESNQTLPAQQSVPSPSSALSGEPYSTALEGEEE